MAHLIAFIIIGAVKMVKWTLFKTRLIIAALPVAAVLIFFKDWYGANTQLADGIGIALTVGVAASWIFTLVRYINAGQIHQGKKAQQRISTGLGI